MKLTVTTIEGAKPEEDATLKAMQAGHGGLLLLIAGGVHTINLQMTLADAEALESQLRVAAGRERGRLAQHGRNR